MAGINWLQTTQNRKKMKTEIKKTLNNKIKFLLLSLIPNFKPNREKYKIITVVFIEISLVKNCHFVFSPMEMRF